MTGVAQGCHQGISRLHSKCGPKAVLESRPASDSSLPAHKALCYHVRDRHEATLGGTMD